MKEAHCFFQCGIQMNRMITLSQVRISRPLPGVSDCIQAERCCLACRRTADASGDGPGLLAVCASAGLYKRPPCHVSCVFALGRYDPTPGSAVCTTESLPAPKPSSSASTGRKLAARSLRPSSASCSASPRLKVNRRAKPANLCLTFRT